MLQDHKNMKWNNRGKRKCTRVLKDALRIVYYSSYILLGPRGLYFVRWRLVLFCIFISQLPPHTTQLVVFFCSGKMWSNSSKTNTTEVTTVLYSMFLLVTLYRKPVNHDMFTNRIHMQPFTWECVGLQIITVKTLILQVICAIFLVYNRLIHSWLDKE